MAPRQKRTTHVKFRKEQFHLNCVVLQEVVIPTELSEIGNRAFCGRAATVQRFTPILDWGESLNSGCRHPHNARLLYV